MVGEIGTRGCPGVDSGSNWVSLRLCVIATLGQKEKNNILIVIACDMEHCVIIMAFYLKNIQDS